METEGGDHAPDFLRKMGFSKAGACYCTVHQLLLSSVTSTNALTAMLIFFSSPNRFSVTQQLFQVLLLTKCTHPPELQMSLPHLGIIGVSWQPSKGFTFQCPFIFCFNVNNLSRHNGVL